MTEEVETVEAPATSGRRSRIVVSSLVAFVVLGAAVSWFAFRSSPEAASKGPEGVALSTAPNLAPASTTLQGQSVGSIKCVTESNEDVNFHTHTYVSVFVNGEERRLPGGIGITQPWLIEKFPTGRFYDVGPYNCLYWVHTHTADNIVHVEAPAKRVFTLGQLFTIWNQPLSSNQVGPAKGKVVVVVNGRKFTGDVQSVPLV
ncbi:MAG: hypothetical protein WCL38_09085, partial [Actinomycetota bacterium]